MTTDRHLLVIAPTAPPNICGVSDYAYLTAQRLAAHYQSTTIGVKDVPVMPTGAASLLVRHWHDALTTPSPLPTDVLLHLTPTSYAWTGLPLNLVRTLQRFRRMNSQNRVFVFFHELWSNSLELRVHQIARNRLARWSAYQIGKLADGITTLTTGQQDNLHELLGPQTDIRLGLVGANIEPAEQEIGFQSDRQAGVWALFGLSHTRLWAMQAHQPLLQSLFAQGKLKQIMAIGPVDTAFATEEAAFAASAFGPGKLVQLGALRPSEVSQQLLSVEAAVIKQDADSLRKSGSFAALAAHAVPVICDVPDKLDSPPGRAIFRPHEIATDPTLLINAEGTQRRRQLHDWFWSTRSWNTISNDIQLWMA
jgi:hypothetical protein